MRRAVLFLAAILAVSMSSLGQNQQPRGNSGVSAQDSPNIPTADLSFRDDHAITGLVASSVMVDPLQCRTNGTVFVQMFSVPITYPPDLHVYSIAETEYREFALRQINDLYDVQMLSWYPGDSFFVFLVFATRESQQGKSTFTFSNGEQRSETRYTGDHHYYIARFDYQGAYKGSVQVEESFQPNKVSVFDSGYFLLLGLDSLTKKPRMALAKPDGGIVSYLDVPDTVSQWYDSAKRSFGVKENDSFGVIPASQMTPFRGNILVVHSGSKAPILQVRDNGEVQRLPFETPKDHSILSLIPSDNHLYVRLGIPKKGESDVIGGPYLIYDIDPSTGKVLRSINEPVSGQTACEHDNQFIAFRRDEQRNFIRMIGELTQRKSVQSKN